MVFKSMKYMMAMMYRWALLWWKCPCGVLSPFYQRMYASCEVWIGWDGVAY